MGNNNKKIKVYLAGGMKSGWQDLVINEFKFLSFAENVEFLDPRSHGLTNEFDYTRADLKMINESNIIFAYLEETNPGGFNTLFELGYARCLGLISILVNDKTSIHQYIGMARSSALLLPSNFRNGIAVLKRSVEFLLSS